LTLPRYPAALNQELRFACRGLWRTKPFTAAAVLTLALGIAATTAMFTVIRGVLLRPLPVRAEDRLVLAWKEVRALGSARYPFGNTEIDAVARASQLLEQAAGVTRNGVGREVVIDNGAAGYANVALVTGGFFEVLGVEPVLGRALRSADDKEGAEHVIVLTDGFWRSRYGGSRDILGRRVILGEQPFTIVGVMPPDLDYPTGVELWRTTSSEPTNGPFGDSARREVNLLGRLGAGVTLDQARSEIAALSRRLDVAAPPDARRDLVPVVQPFTDVVVGDVRTTMLALFAAVGLLLLTATTNVANLLLMRGEARRAERAVRAALGAGRGRMVREVLIESAVLSAAAGVLGLALAWWCIPPLIAIVPDGLPRVEAIRIDTTVVLFSVTVVFMTAVVAGIVPAISSLPSDLLAGLHSGGRGTIGPAARHGRRALVVAQVGLAVTIVAAAALLIRSALKLQSVDSGLPAGRLVLLDLDMPQTKYADRRRHAQFLDAAIARLEAAPAIAAATPVNVAPFSGQGWDLPTFTAEGQSLERAASNPSLDIESVHPNYFAALQVALVRGRAFTAADREGTPEVAIVSEEAAARAWPGENPLGRRLKMGGPEAPGPWYTVVGVAAQTRYRELTRARPILYLPAAQFQMTATMLVLRTAAPIELLAPLSRQEIAAVAPDVRVMRVAPFAELLARPLARPRFTALLLGVFGAAALLLSSIGLYAVMAAYVRQRDREIALRLALGASAAGVRRFVLAEAVRLAGLGASIGFGGSLIATRFLRGLLFEIDSLDPPTLMAAALLLVAAAALASYLPVRRATRVDVTAMLRSQ
jgi:putative ABC transport system permease protein